MDITMKKNTWNVTFAMTTSGQYIIMTDITTMDFQSVSYHACNECHDTLFGPFRLGLVDNKKERMRDILEVINDRTEKEGKNTTTTIDYYEAARIAYTDREHMRNILDSKIDIEEINKWFRPIWEFTYRIVSGEDK